MVMKPAPNHLVLGYFHECGDDDTFSNSIDDFRRAKNGYWLFITSDSKLIAFYGPDPEGEIASEWRNWVGQAAISSHFETIEFPDEWIDTWSDRFADALRGIKVK